MHRPRAAAGRGQCAGQLSAAAQRSATDGLDQRESCDDRFGRAASSEHGLPRRAGQAHQLQWLWGCQDRLSSAMVGILSVGGGAADRAAWLLLRGPRTLPVWSGALGSGLHDISTKVYAIWAHVRNRRLCCSARGPPHKPSSREGQG